MQELTQQTIRIDGELYDLMSRSVDSSNAVLFCVRARDGKMGMLLLEAGPDRRWTFYSVIPMRAGNNWAALPELPPSVLLE